MKYISHFFSLFLVLGFLFQSHESLGVLSTPSITYPYNNSMNLPVTFISSFSGSGAKYYVVEIDTVSTFTSKYCYRTTKSDLVNYKIDSLGFKKKYFMHVKSFNSTNTDSSKWSTIISFTSIGNTTLSKTESLAIVGFSWNKDNYTLMEIQIDTTILFNSKRFQSTITTLTNHNFKYTRSNQKYYYRYRYRYGSQKASWYSGTVMSFEGFLVNTNFKNDSFLFKRNIQLITNYDGDSNVNYTVIIDTVKTFNSSNLFTLKTQLNSFDFILKSKTNYFMKIVMTYPNNVWGADSIYKFSISKISKEYIQTYMGSVLFSLPPDFIKGTIEIDTTLAFNSPLKQHIDTIFKASMSTQTFYQNYNLISLYHNKYLRYKISTATETLDWYCNNKRILVPSYTVDTIVKPVHFFSNYGYVYDSKGIMVELDTSLQFNSKLKVKSFGLIKTGLNFGPLKFGKTYYLRAKHFNATMDTTDWGKPAKLKVIDTTHVSDPSTNVIYNYSLQLYCYQKLGIKAYQWQLDTLPNFKTPVNYFSPSHISSYPNILLWVGKRYYCRMRMITEVDTSIWHKTRWFDYKMGQYLLKPFLIYPTDSSINIPAKNLTFLWRDNTGGVSTNYEFKLQKEGEAEIFSDLEQSFIKIKTLDPYSKYTWSVKAIAKGYYSDQAMSKYSFTTGGESRIDRLLSSKFISIYPNPSDFWVEVKLNTPSLIDNITITTMEGIDLWNQSNIKSKAVKLDISLYPKGIYFVSIQNDEGIFNSKFIKY